MTQHTDEEGANELREEYRSAHYKLLRAFDHMAILEPQIEAWRSGGGYTVVTGRDPETGQKTARFQCSQFPPEWGPIIGDILQGLRNALDNIVFGIASACGPLKDKQAEQIAFPIKGATPLSTSHANQAMRNVPVPVQDVIKGKQPHGTPDYKLSVLWVLHRLANIDKHRSTHVAAVHNRGVQGLPPDGMDYLPTDRIWTSASGVELENGTVVAEYRPLAGAEGPEADVQFKLAPEVIFQEVELVKLPVLSVLHTSGAEVTNICRSIVGAYEGTLPSP